MNFDKYNIDKFLKRIEGKNLPDIIKYGEEEIHRAEKNSFNIKGAAKNREAGSIEYAQQIKEILFLLHHEQRPGTIEDYLLKSLMPICKRLVAKKQLNADVMKIFNNQ